MVKQAAKALAPGLRFPEFRDAPGFSPRPLSHAFLRITNGKANAQDHVEGGTYPLFDRSEVVKASNEFLFSSEAVILPGEGMAFRPRHFDGNFNLHQRAYALMECQGHAKFFFYALDYAKDDLALKAVKSTVLSLRLPIIEKFVLYAPGKAEQKRIADCLTSLDEVIAAQGRKVEALKAHKRGLMQQLFPREGETRPSLRFPEFRDAPEWDERKLGELTTIVRGGSPRPIDDFLTLEAVGLNWLKIGDVDREAKYITGTAEKVLPEALSKTRVIQPGDFILSNSMSFGRPYISTITTCIHDGWIAVTNVPDSLNREFLYYSLLSDRSQKYFVDQAAGSGVKNLNKDIIKLLVLGFPEEKEQQRIADCISSLDTQITAESNRLAALKTHKQSLMQQLFPAPDAATA